MQRLITFIFVGALSVAGPAYAGNEDHEGIKQTILNYIGGWYEGDANRMAGSLHKNLSKRKPLGSQGTGLRALDKTTLVNFTRAGHGKTGKDKQIAEISLIDVHKNIASAKLTSLSYVDYFHLVKVNGEWQILSALWVNR